MKSFQPRIIVERRSISVPFGDGGNPSPLGEEKGVVMWLSATIPSGSAHEIRSKSALGVGSKISQESTARGGGGTCAGFVEADSDGA